MIFSPKFLSISRLIFLSPFRRRRALVPSLVRSVVLEKLVHGRSDGRCCSTRAPANAEAMRWSMYEGTEADFLGCSYHYRAEYYQQASSSLIVLLIVFVSYCINFLSLFTYRKQLYIVNYRCANIDQFFFSDLWFCLTGFFIF